jgi:hypothetical protein
MNPDRTLIGLGLAGALAVDAAEGAGVTGGAGVADGVGVGAAKVGDDTMPPTHARASPSPRCWRQPGVTCLLQPASLERPSEARPTSKAATFARQIGQSTTKVFGVEATAILRSVVARRQRKQIRRSCL